MLVKLAFILLVALCLPRLSFGAAPTFVNVGAEVSVISGDLTLAAPATPVSGDIWVACVQSSDQVAHAFTDWTEIVNFNGGGTQSRVSAWWFRYAGTPPNLVLTHTAGDMVIAGIAAFRGAKASGSPIVTTGATNGANGTTFTYAGITPGASNTMLVACHGSEGVTVLTKSVSLAAAFEPGAGDQYESADGTDGSVGLFYASHVSGPTGDFTATITGARDWGAVLFAIEGIIAGTTASLTGVGR